MAERILIVEDDVAIGEPLSRTLGAQGYDVEWVQAGVDALGAARRKHPALVVLDLGLPDADGLEVCRTLRGELDDTSIVMLTARVEEIDVVVGLDAGANDYITKPFRLAELLARVRAQLRDRARNEDTLRVGDLVVDLASRRAFAGERELELRPREFDLLALLASAPGEALTREHIMSTVWDQHWFGSTKTLDVHVSALRRKLAHDPSVERPVITGLRGVGYRLDVR